MQHSRLTYGFAGCFRPLHNTTPVKYHHPGWKLLHTESSCGFHIALTSAAWAQARDMVVSGSGDVGHGIIPLSACPCERTFQNSGLLTGVTSYSIEASHDRRQPQTQPAESIIIDQAPIPFGLRRKIIGQFSVLALVVLIARSESQASRSEHKELFAISIESDFRHVAVHFDRMVVICELAITHQDISHSKAPSVELFNLNMSLLTYRSCVR
jgi:hypothetical protein